MGTLGFRRSRSFIITAATSMLLVAACSSGSDSGSSGGGGGGTNAAGSATGDAKNYATMPLDQLYELAKAEGTFTFYGDGHAMPDLYKEFAKTYPGIKLNEVDDQDSALAVRAQAEASAGKVVGDAWGSPTESLDALVKGGLIEKMTAPEAAAFPAEDKTDYWVGKEVQPDGICYNTDKVAPADVPKTWNDLADPKYKKYSIGVDPDAWIVLLAYVEKKYGGDKSKAEDVFKSIAATNKLVPGTGGRALVNSLVAGDIDIDMNCNVYIEAAAEKDGAPVAVSKEESVPEPVGIAVMKGAPHPAAAWLIVRWELSDAGQKAYADIGRVPGNPNIPPTIDVTTKNQYFVAPDVVSQSAEDYAAEWKQIFDLH